MSEDDTGSANAGEVPDPSEDVDLTEPHIDLTPNGVAPPWREPTGGILKALFNPYEPPSDLDGIMTGSQR